jgi:regulator of sigma E protease
MLGCIVVNLVVGFLIYIMIFWGYGKTFVSNESLENGYSFGEVMQKYGFENGDRILSMNGKEVLTSDEINKAVMLRSAREFEVLKQDGTTNSISLPENVEYEVFATEGMQIAQPRILPIIGTVVDTLEAGKKGIKSGDVVVSINDEPIEFWDEMTDRIRANKNNEITLTVSRDNEQVDIMLVVNEEGIIGIGNEGDLTKHGLKLETMSLGLGAAFSEGLSHGYNTLRDYVVSLKFLFTSKGASSLGGVGTIASLFGKTWNWQGFWVTTAFLSFMLAFLNLLPIPALDGGHVMFTLVEMITGRKLPEKFMEYAQMFGIILLLGLMLYANGMDVFRAFK